jgi:hypothetical protein
MQLGERRFRQRSERAEHLELVPLEAFEHRRRDTFGRRRNAAAFAIGGDANAARAERLAEGREEEAH